MRKVLKYFKNILISFDQFLNTLLLGDPDETISSRIGKMIRWGTAGDVEKGLCKALDGLDKNHCEKSIEEDEGKNEIT